MRKLRLGKGSGPCSKSEGKVLVGLGLQARLLLNSNALFTHGQEVTPGHRPQFCPSPAAQILPLLRWRHRAGLRRPDSFSWSPEPSEGSKTKLLLGKSTTKTETRATRRAEQLTSRNWKKGGGVVAFAPFLFECHLDISMKIREYATKPLGARVLNSEFNTAIQNVLVWICENERTLGNTSLFRIPPAHTSITGAIRRKAVLETLGILRKVTPVPHPCNISSGLLHRGQIF